MQLGHRRFRGRIHPCSLKQTLGVPAADIPASEGIQNFNQFLIVLAVLLCQVTYHRLQLLPYLAIHHKATSPGFAAIDRR